MPKIDEHPTRVEIRYYDDHVVSCTVEESFFAASRSAKVFFLTSSVKSLNDILNAGAMVVHNFLSEVLYLRCVILSLVVVSLVKWTSSDSAGSRVRNLNRRAKRAFVCRKNPLITNCKKISAGALMTKEWVCEIH